MKLTRWWPCVYFDLYADSPSPDIESSGANDQRNSPRRLQINSFKRRYFPLFAASSTLSEQTFFLLLLSSVESFISCLRCGASSSGTYSRMETRQRSGRFNLLVIKRRVIKPMKVNFWVFRRRRSVTRRSLLYTYFSSATRRNFACIRTH